MEVDKNGNYHAFLLRLWRDDGGSPWRVMLEDPHTGQKCSLASMPDLYAFLDQVTDIFPGDDIPPDHPAPG